MSISNSSNPQLTTDWTTFKTNNTTHYPSTRPTTSQLWVASQQWWWVKFNSQWLWYRFVMVLGGNWGWWWIQFFQIPRLPSSLSCSPNINTPLPPLPHHSRTISMKLWFVTKWIWTIIYLCCHSLLTILPGISYYLKEFKFDHF